MARWCGMIPKSEALIAVDLELDEEGATVLREHTYRLQKGNRADALSVLHSELSVHLQESNVYGVVIKASSASRQAVKLNRFHAAEVRGVALAASAEKCRFVAEENVGILNRKLRDRDVSSYLNDEDWWNDRGLSNLKKGSREAAFIVIALHSNHVGTQ